MSGRRELKSANDAKAFAAVSLFPVRAKTTNVTSDTMEGMLDATKTFNTSVFQ